MKARAPQPAGCLPHFWLLLALTCAVAFIAALPHYLPKVLFRPDPLAACFVTGLLLATCYCTAKAAQA